MWVYVCIGSRVGEKKLGWCIRVQGLSSTMYLPTYPIRKSCIYFLYRRDLLRGKGPIFPLAKQFSFLFCLARFCQIKICIYNSYCYTYIHTYIVTQTKPVCAKITPLLPSVVNCPKKKPLWEYVHYWGVVEQTQAYYRLSINPISFIFDSNT